MLQNINLSLSENEKIIWQSNPDPKRFAKRKIFIYLGMSLFPIYFIISRLNSIVNDYDLIIYLEKNFIKLTIIFIISIINFIFYYFENKKSANTVKYIITNKNIIYKNNNNYKSIPYLKIENICVLKDLNRINIGDIEFTLQSSSSLLNYDNKFYFAGIKNPENVYKIANKYFLTENEKEKNGEFDIDFIDSYGNSNLMHYVANGDIKMVKKLINLGANINNQNNIGLTPLMSATKNGYTDIVKFLIIHKANITLKDDNNMSALDYAKEIRRKDIIDLLNKKTHSKR